MLHEWFQLGNFLTSYGGSLDRAGGCRHPSLLILLLKNPIQNV